MIRPIPPPPAFPIGSGNAAARGRRAPRRSSIRPAPPRPRHFMRRLIPRRPGFIPLDVHLPHGPGSRTAARLRAPARAEAAAHRLRRRGRARGARRDARQALDQEGLEAAGLRPRRPDDGPDDARGRRHARQGRRALLEGDAARPGRPVDPVRRRRLRLPEPRRDREGAARRLRRQGRLGRDGVPVRPVAARGQARRRARGGRARRRRDRHGDRPRRLPLRPLREGLRRDRPGEGGLRRRAPEGDPRDRRARHVRQRPPRLAARDGRRRRLHQDVDRQGQPGRDAAGHALHARGDPRRPRRDRPHRRDEARGRDPHREAGDPVPRRPARDARPRSG